MKISIIILLCMICGCTPFNGQRTSKIELNILGSTWKSETTLKGEYTEVKKP